MKAPRTYLKIFAVVAAAVLLLVVTSFVVFYLHNVEAQTYTPAVGPGWIRFSSDNLGVAAADTHSYGVFVNSDGLLMGEAWSDNYGWLSFNQSDLTNCPPNLGPCQASFDASSGALSGWAKFMGTGNWVSLRGTINIASLPTPVSQVALFLRKTLPPVASLFDLLNARAQTGYGVNYNSGTGKISGVAWGDNTGWIVFGNPATPSQASACATCSVTGQLLNQLPTVSNVQVATMPADSSWCDPTPYYRISWAYYDADGDSQASAKIDFKQVSDPTQVYTVNMNGGNFNYNLQDPLANLAPNTDYQAWVTVNDGLANSLAPAGSPVFRTPPHYYPLVSMNFTPNPFSAPNIVSFTTDVQVRSHGAPGPFTWYWAFSNAGAPTPDTNSQNVSVLIQKFPSVATSTITDADGHSCSGSLDLGNVTGGAGSSIKRRIFKEL